jgi:tripartite-type tricarboxylate transporter receptor subunit TctC
MTRITSAAAAIALGLSALGAAAQTYPDKSIRFICPYAPGGTTDILTRAIAQKLSESMKQSVVVENRAGAGGNIGSEVAAKAPPDGYTILMAPVSPLAINPSLYGSKMPFNPQRDFQPLTLVAKVPLVLATHPVVPVKNVKELIAFAKARPGKLTYGSSGNGSSNHLIGEMFKAAAGVNIVHVPYKGSGPSIIALLSGELDMIVGQIPSVLSQVNAHRIRALAISGAKRSPAMRDVPTLNESGLPGFDATSWYAVVAPAGIPRPIVDRLHAELVKAINSSEVRGRLTDEGADIETTTPDALAQFVRGELDKWAKAVKVSGAKLD